MRKILLFPLTFILFALLTASCGSTTKVVSSWQSPGATVPSIGKVLVLAMMADREAKDYIENTLASDLAAQGVTVVTGTAEFGPRGFGSLTTQQQVTDKLKNDGFGAIMIVCLTAKDKQLDYVPGTPYTGPTGTYGGYYGRYRYMWDTIYSPGYYTTSTTYVLDADLFTIADDKLIYSAQTRTYDPTNSKDLAASFSEEIVKDLLMKKIIQ